MKIHILPSIGSSALHNVIKLHVTEAGHEVTDQITEANYVIGLVDSPEWHQVGGPSQIILKSPEDVDTVPKAATLFHIVLLTMLSDPLKTFHEWLKDAPDPFEVD